MKKCKVVKIFVLSIAVTMLFGGCAKKINSQDYNKNVKVKIKEENTPLFVAEAIRRIKIISEGKALYSIEYAPEEYENSYEYWKMEIPYENKAVVNTEEMVKIYDALEALNFTEQKNTENIDTGLNNPTAEIEIDFCQASKEERDTALTYHTGDQENKTFGANADSTCTLLVGADDGNGNYYTCLKAKKDVVYLMNKDDIDLILNTDPFSLILKVGTLVDVNTVKEVKICMDENTYSMENEKEKYFLNKEETNESAYHDLYMQLLSVMVEKEFNGEVFDEEPLLELEFIRNSKKAENVRVKYLRYDEKYCILSQDNVENFLVKYDDVVKLKDSIKECFN